MYYFHLDHYVGHRLLYIYTSYATLSSDILWSALAFSPAYTKSGIFHGISQESINYSVFYAIENTAANTTSGRYARQMMGRLDVIKKKNEAFRS